MHALFTQDLGPTTPARAARTYNPAHNTHHRQPICISRTNRVCVFLPRSLTYPPIAPIPVHHTCLFQVAEFRYKGCLRQPRPGDHFDQFKPSTLIFGTRGRAVACPEQALLNEKRQIFKEWVQGQKNDAKKKTINATSNGGGDGGGSATTKSGNASKGGSGRLLVGGEGGAREGGAESGWAPEDLAHANRMVIERQLGDCDSQKCKQARPCFVGGGCSARGGDGQWPEPYMVRLRLRCVESRSAVHLST